MRSIAVSNLAHTYSIVARDVHSGELGVAVQSHWFSVGSLVCWAGAGVGAVATQSIVRVDYGPLGLERMRAGMSAQEALAELIVKDEGRDLRQVGMVDCNGRASAHTGQRCIAQAGHVVGEGFCTQANMMTSASVWPAMAQAYRKAQGDLSERMLAALEAAQEAGGDVRGKQSAAMLVVGPKRMRRRWEGVLLDLRVEDHPEPLVELRRLVGLHRAYQHMNCGDDLLAQQRVEEALEEYAAAARMAPEIAELPFWHAVTLADLQRMDEALPLFREVFARDPKLAVLVQRLPAARILREDREMMAQILSASC